MKAPLSHRKPPLLRARLTLCEAVAIVLRNVLTLLGIEAPESM